MPAAANSLRFSLRHVDTHKSCKYMLMFLSGDSLEMIPMHCVLIHAESTPLHIANGHEQKGVLCRDPPSRFLCKMYACCYVPRIDAIDSLVSQCCCAGRLRPVLPGTLIVADYKWLGGRNSSSRIVLVVLHGRWFISFDPYTYAPLLPDCKISEQKPIWMRRKYFFQLN